MQVRAFRGILEDRKVHKLTEKVRKLREDNLHSYRFAVKDAKTRVVTRPRAKLIRTTAGRMLMIFSTNWSPFLWRQLFAKILIELTIIYHTYQFCPVHLFRQIVIPSPQWAPGMGPYCWRPSAPSRNRRGTLMALPALDLFGGEAASSASCSWASCLFLFSFRRTVQGLHAYWEWQQCKAVSVMLGPTLAEEHTHLD